MRGATLVATVAFAATGLLASLAPVGAQEAEHPGKAVYDKWCAECHGVDGDGRGPAAEWMLPRPRDFVQAMYQVRTTPSGQLPTDEDILRIIDEGMPGTTMPGWESHLGEDERLDLVDYLKSFYRFADSDEAPAPLEIGRAPRLDDEALARGRELFQEIECWKCHGQEGRGDGPSAPTQTDHAGLPIRPADLSENWLFNGGGSVEAIYTRLRTGMDGTPMPSFADLVDAGIVTDEELWMLAHYVRSLSPEERPVVEDVVRAALVEGELPSSPGEEAWAAAESYYVPLVGQVIVEPRWFAPAVDGVWVQALHNGEELAMRLVWHDPSESPDPAWEEWRGLIAQHLEPGAPDASGAPPPDAFVVQFPATMPEGRELPYFLGGDARDPVYRWHWVSDGGLREELARGLDQVEPLTAVGDVRGAAEFDAGEWRLVIRRPLDSQDPQRRIAMPTGEPIPVAFFARDGSSGETGGRGSVSSWYYLYLDTPVPVTAYVLPVAAALLTALLGLGMVIRARRTERHHTERSTETLLEGA